MSPPRSPPPPLNLAVNLWYIRGLHSFDAAVRAFVLRTFEITYQSVPVPFLLQSLGLESEGELKPLVEPRGWKVTGEMASIPSNDDNTAKKKVADAGDVISLAEMGKILQSVAVAAA